MLSTKTKLIATGAFGVFGAAMLWLFAATGFNAWGATTGWYVTLSYVMAAVLAAWASLSFTRTKPPATRWTIAIVAAVVWAGLSYFTNGLGLREWLAFGPSWHAALVGFLTFGGAAAVSFFWLQKNDKN